MGSADPPGKMDEKFIKQKHAKKSSFLNGGFGWGEVIRVMTGWSGGKGALTPLTKILRTLLLMESHFEYMLFHVVSSFPL